VHGICYTLFLLVLPLLVLAGLNVRLIREVKALGRRRLRHDETRTTTQTRERDETNRENPNIASNE